MGSSDDSAPEATGPEAAARGRLLERLTAIRTRGELKQLAADLEHDPRLRATAEALAAERGHAVATGATSAKQLVRRLLDREGEARARSNPIHRDDPFTCHHCGADVGRGGAPPRDHCPHCLRGRHLDVVPGDRAAGCGGPMEPVELERRADEVTIAFRCRTCGYTFRARAHPDDRIPPSLAVADLDR